MEPIEIPIDGTLDLHTFRPAEVKDLLDDYIAACLEKEIYSLRIIHGKGQGVLKKRVQSILKKDNRVVRFTDAEGTGGGWGATVVELAARYQK
ncbi:MAG TPA: Smr/MutS family protein [Desulfosalsimonadaceae bacterium]|nr:Smr/MutS family protein [Desulfosalsimonadaceae bacterium]